MLVTVPVLCVLAALLQSSYGDMSDILAKVNNMSNDKIPKDSDRPTTSRVEPLRSPLRISCIKQEPFIGMDLSTGRVRGLEIELINTLAQHMDLKVTFELSENRSMFMQKLIDKTTDILIGGLFISDLDTENVSITSAMRISSIPYVFDDMTWCVATAKERPKWMNIFCIFPPWMWVSLLVIGYINATIIYILMLFEVSQNRWDFHRVCLFILSSNLTIAIRGLTPTSPGLTMFYVCLLFYGIVLIAAFNSSFIQNLTKPIRWDQVDSMDMVLMDMMQVMGDPKAFLLYDSDGQNEISAFVRQHFWPCPDIDLCLDQLADRDDLAVAVSRLHSRNTRRIYASQMFCFPQAKGNIINYPVRMLMRAGFPHVGRVNDIIRRAFETGLIQKWSRDSERSAVPLASPGTVVVLTMEHLSGAWFTVCSGLPLSALIFWAELLTWRRVQIAKPGKGRRWAVWIERVIMSAGRSYLNGPEDEFVYLA